MIKTKPKKSLGQNFLHDAKILNQIINEGNISPDDIVLEIGPGTGKLTEKILEKKPKSLIAVEKDRSLSVMLNKKFGNKINLINKSILDCYSELKFNKPIKVFGNLPYNISTKILISFLNIEQLNQFYEKFIFIFQKEVADRIIAKENAKEYGRLSVLTSWRFNRLKIFDIPPDCFFPKPKVWSSLITLCPRKNFEILKKNRNLEHITRIFFNQRRKMIKKPMKMLFKNYAEIAKILNIDLHLRPQNISKDKYLEICKIYEGLVQ